MSNRLWIMTQHGSIKEVMTEVYISDALKSPYKSIILGANTLGIYHNEERAVEVLRDIIKWIANNQNTNSFVKTVFVMPQDDEVIEYEL